jgi:hypothetical protein
VKPALKTGLLAAAAALLLALNLFDPGDDRRAVAALPTLAAISKDEVKRVEISTALEKVILQAEVEEGADGAKETVWYLAGQNAGLADQAAVKALILGFRKELALDVKVDAGTGETLADYGLDAGNGVVVELFGEGPTPAVSFVLGKDAPGGSSFLRLPGSDDIFRARVGGRPRYERPAAAWRNRVVMGFDEPSVQRFVIERPERPPLTFTRGEGSAWQMSPDLGWPADGAALAATLSGLGSLKAGELLESSFDGGFSPPLATARVSLSDGRALSLELGSRETDGAFFVRQGSLVGKVARGPLARLLAEPGDWRDHTLFAFRRDEVDTLRYRSGADEVILQQDLASGLWRVIQPQNVDIDVKLVFFAVNTMAELRGDALLELSPEAAGLVPPAQTITARMIGGREAVLQLGPPRKDAMGRLSYPARAGDSPVIFTLREPTVDKLLAAFARQGGAARPE